MTKLNKQNSFSNKELKKIFNWLRQESENFSPYSNWEILIRQWNVSNPDKKVSLKLEQPEF